MLRRAILMLFAFVIACGGGAMFLVIASLTDPETRRAGFDAAIAGFFALLDGALDEEPGAPIGAASTLLWGIFMASCAGPLAVAALLAEAAGVRSLLWHAGASGVLAAASPWILRATRGLERAGAANAAEERIALLLFLTGAVTGAIYWLIAGRGAATGQQLAEREPRFRG